MSNNSLNSHFFPVKKEKNYNSSKIFLKRQVIQMLIYKWKKLDSSCLQMSKDCMYEQINTDKIMYASIGNVY